MCGIIGYVGSREPKAILLDGLKRLEYRGYDSAGIAVLSDEGLRVVRAEGRIESLEKKVATEDLRGSVGIGHTRWATHGAPIERNAHPHRVGSVVLAHNGIIENYATHRKRLLDAGRKIESDTDSEIVAHLIDLKLETEPDLGRAVQAVLPDLEGSYAFVIASDKSPGTLVAVRNGSPLLVGFGEGELFCASDVQAVLSHTKRFSYLEDRQMVVCRGSEAKFFDEKGATFEPAIKEIDWSADQLDKVGYEHFMLKEIYDQPRAITNTIEGNISHVDEIVGLTGLKDFAAQLKQINRVTIVACGTSLHAGLIGKYYFEQFARVPTEVDYASEFRYRNPVTDKDGLFVFISQSGETADTLAALREMKARAVPTVAITNVRESSLAREADIVLYTNAGPEIGVASTKAFTAQLATLYMLAVQVGHVQASLFKAQYQELTHDLVRLPFLVERALGTAKQMKELADHYKDYRCFFFVGRGIHYPVALEGALKLKEITYLHAEGYPAGELKHGPIALIDENVLTFVLAPASASSPPNAGPKQGHVYYEKLMANLEEVKARNGKIVALGSQDDTRLRERATHFVGIPPASWACNPILLTVPVQLFAYYVALARGTDIDKPRNLAKSVTVE